MTNLMFCQRGIKVNILYDTTYFDTCFWMLGLCFDLEISGLLYNPDVAFDVGKFNILRETAMSLFDKLIVGINNLMREH